MDRQFSVLNAAKRLARTDLPKLASGDVSSDSELELLLASGENEGLDGVPEVAVVGS